MYPHYWLLCVGFVTWKFAKLFISSSSFSGGSSDSWTIHRASCADPYSVGRIQWVRTRGSGRKDSCANGASWCAFICRVYRWVVQINVHIAVKGRLVLLALGHVRITLMVWSGEKPDTRLFLSESKTRKQKSVVWLILLNHNSIENPS